MLTSSYRSVPSVRVSNADQYYYADDDGIDAAYMQVSQPRYVTADRSAVRYTTQQPTIYRETDGGIYDRPVVYSSSPNTRIIPSPSQYAAQSYSTTPSYSTGYTLGNTNRVYSSEPSYVSVRDQGAYTTSYRSSPEVYTTAQPQYVTSQPQYVTSQPQYVTSTHGTRYEYSRPESQLNRSVQVIRASPTSYAY